MVLSPIEQTVLVQILKISSDLLNKYTTVQDRLVWLIFIPHVLLFIFIWIFADNIAKMGGGVHTGVRTLVGIAAYITIIFAGWYGTMIVPIFISLWQMILAIALIMFVASRFLHPARAKEMMALGKMVGEKVTEKDKVRKRLEHELEATEKMMTEIQSMTPTTSEGMSAQQMQVMQLKARKAALKHELENL
jgi:hypothetical protein